MDKIEKLQKKKTMFIKEKGKKGSVKMKDDNSQDDLKDEDGGSKEKGEKKSTSVGDEEGQDQVKEPGADNTSELKTDSNFEDSQEL